MEKKHRERFQQVMAFSGAFCGLREGRNTFSL